MILDTLLVNTTTSNFVGSGHPRAGPTLILFGCQGSRSGCLREKILAALRPRGGPLRAEMTRTKFEPSHVRPSSCDELEDA